MAPTDHVEEIIDLADGMTGRAGPRDEDSRRGDDPRRRHRQIRVLAAG